MAHLRWKLEVLCCACLTSIFAMFALQWSLTNLLKTSNPIANAADTRTVWTPGTNVSVTDNRNLLGNLLDHSASEILRSKSGLVPDCVTERRFASSENERVFILGAVAKNSTPGARWDRVVLYGQWYGQRSLNVSDLKCCFKYSDGSVTQSVLSDHMVRGYPGEMQRAPLVDWHITCVVPGCGPWLVSIARYSSCNNESVSYVKPHYAMKKADGHTVITTKLAYNKVRPEIVAGFLEAAKLLGINKVVTYVCNNLDPNIKAILRYYAYAGILEYHAIELADEKGTPRKFDLFGQYRNDEWLVMRDALERNFGATYFGIFDMDEYLIPSNNRSIPILLNDLRKQYPNASNFWFKNVHFLTDNSTCARNASNCSLIRRHIMTSPLRFNIIHRKMFLMPSMVVAKTISNHNIKPLPGFRDVTCPEIEAYVRHYGSCKRKFRKRICRAPSRWVKDTTMVAWAERAISNNVKNVLTYVRH